MKMNLNLYRISNPVRPGARFARDTEDQRLALGRARQLADFYREPFEVCQVVGPWSRPGVTVRPVSIAGRE